MTYPRHVLFSLIFVVLMAGWQAGYPLAAFAESTSSVYSDYQYNGNKENNVPVNNDHQLLTNNVANSPAQTTMSLEQRVNRLTQQLANQQRLNIPAQIQELQQEIQDLRGQLQVQAYDLKKLRQQQQTLYKQLETRASKRKQSTPKHAKLTSNVKAKTKNATSAKDNQRPDLIVDQNAYEKAYHLLTKQKYNRAVLALKQYLKTYPQGRYVSNAHYWLGELYLIQNKDALAVKEFETVITQFPESNKIADAKLKLGFVYLDNGQIVKAKRQLKRVIKSYPGTSVARLAQSRLQSVQP